MGKTLRVHTLAKELGVSSKDILAKCLAEGLDLKNHMAVISVGLAESIREWFSSGADVTTVEVAEPVDLDRIKKTTRRRVKSAKDSEGHDASVATVSDDDAETHLADESAEAAIADSEPTPPQPEVALVPAAIAPPEAPTAEPEPTPAVAEIAEQDAATPQIAVDDVSDTPPSPPAPEIPTPAKPAPAPIRPAGPQLVPAPAELRGPRVVRIEAPEPVRAPRPRPGPYRPGEAPAARAGTTSAPPPAGGDTGARPHGRPRKDDGDASARPRSPRRGGITEVVERLKEWRDQDVLERKERLASATGHGLRARRSAERIRQTAAPTPSGRRAEVEISTPISVKDFCSAVGVPFNTLSTKLMQTTGRLMRIIDMLDFETAELLGVELGVELKLARTRSALEKLQDRVAQQERSHLKPRPPVVAMLGHVDHGKTSLLDAIRRTKVAAGEAGGITQHIGAYRVDRGEWHVTFLDTPGHEAFTAMRARGANLTDVVVLVVAADDGIMPQTIEAMNHAKAAGVQIVVALNKCDLPSFDQNRIYAQLSEHELTPSEWGGTTDVIKTSAITGMGVDDLLAHLSTLSELLDLKADPTVAARATVIEARMREGQGVTAQVLIREGTLKTGAVVLCGGAHGRVRTLIDDKGKRVPKAEPGTPVQVSGLDELPEAGDELYVLESAAEAKTIALEVREQRRTASLTATRKPTSLEALLGASDDSIPELSVIVRADVQGSVDALKSKLAEFPSDKARLKILHAGVGTVSEADVHLARASSAIIIAFHVVPDDAARRLADEFHVEIRQYRVIYEMLADVHRALQGMLTPLEKEEQRGRAEVRQVFNVARIGTIAGCMVVDGTIHRSHRVRLVRDGRVIVERVAMASLKRFKDDAREVRAGLECGIKLEGYDDVKPGDVIEAFEVVEFAPEL